MRSLILLFLILPSFALAQECRAWEYGVLMINSTSKKSDNYLSWDASNEFLVWTGEKLSPISKNQIPATDYFKVKDLVPGQILNSLGNKQWELVSTNYALTKNSDSRIFYFKKCIK